MDIQIPWKQLIRDLVFQGRDVKLVFLLVRRDHSLCADADVSATLFAGIREFPAQGTACQIDDAQPYAAAVRDEAWTR